MTDNKFPPFQYVVASLDGAFDEKEENDASALTIWGIFSNEHGLSQGDAGPCLGSEAPDQRHQG